MYEAIPIPVPTIVEKLFHFFLLFYPEQYRKKYGQEIFLLFQDMYQEELIKKGKVGFGFWFSQIGDITKSIIEQHIDMIQKQGIKKYFHINKYNIIGSILLSPFLLLFGLDFIGRLVQGDFTHYNRAFYSVISHTILYSNYNGQIPLLWIVLVFSPLLAVILNLIPFIATLKQNKKKITIKLLFFANPLAVIIVCLGLSCLLVVYRHDVVPCFVHGILSRGFGSIGHTISICRNA